MRLSILDKLVCPYDYSQLELIACTREDDHIMEGFLVCPEHGSFPVIGGVPRMLPAHLLAFLPDDYPDFYRKYGHITQAPGSGADKTAKVQRHTQEAFGFEWTWAGDYHAENFRDWLPDGLDPFALFQGKTGLEVGCGAGRHAELTSSIAASHFAVDLSRAVDSSFARNRGNPRCHVVQADAFHLPFRPAHFDYVYCLGVLQHMHEPPEGFKALARQPRPGGNLLINVYQKSRPIALFALECLRQVTTRMPNRALAAFSIFCGLIDYGCFVGPWKGFQETAAGKILSPVVPRRIKEYAKHDYNTCMVDWFDRLSCPVKKHYTDEELASWYSEAGYEDISVTPYWQAFWNGCGQKSRLRETTQNIGLEQEETIAA